MNASSESGLCATVMVRTFSFAGDEIEVGILKL